MLKALYNTNDISIQRRIYISTTNTKQKAVIILINTIK